MQTVYNYQRFRTDGSIHGNSNEALFPSGSDFLLGGAVEGAVHFPMLFVDSVTSLRVTLHGLSLLPNMLRRFGLSSALNFSINVRSAEPSAKM
jgi:hypothetical protein